jgi:DNA-binding GntR family transcriptional regulator
VKAEIGSPVLASMRMDKRTLKEQVVKLLREAILSGRIKPGQRLNESELSRDLGLSRIPVREALQKLQEQGLVVDVPRRGKFVINLTEEEIQKINSLRIILEGEALRLARGKITGEGIRDLEKLVGQMERFREAPEFEAAALDIEFHHTIWSYSGNEYLAKTLEGITIPLFAHRVLWRINREILGWGSILSNQHRALVNFIEGKVDRPAEEVMLEHLSYRYQQPERFSSLALLPSGSQAAPQS